LTLLPQIVSRPIVAASRALAPGDVVAIVAVNGFNYPVAAVRRPGGGGYAHEPLRDRVRPRGPVGQPHDFHSLGAEDLIEAFGELAVAIAEQELGLQRSVLELPLRARTWEVDLM